jgi:subtilase family serine protease
MTPEDNQTIYNLNPLYANGISGQGQTIVLVEDTDTYNGTGDWDTYRAALA